MTVVRCEASLYSSRPWVGALVKTVVAVAICGMWVLLSGHGRGEDSSTVADDEAGETEGDYFDRPYDEIHEEEMIARIQDQIDRYFDRYRERVVDARGQRWQRDTSSWAKYAESVEVNRQHLQRILGTGDPRLPQEMQQFGEVDATGSGVVASAPGYTVSQVRWPVLDGVWGEGLLLAPKRPLANVVVLPDADQAPEQVAGLAPMDGIASEAFASRLAAGGIRVVVPTLISRDHAWSGTARAVPNRHWQAGRDELLELRTDMPHREWVYRQAYVMGRHVIGFEVQKTLAVVDWFQQQSPQLPIGVAGYGEGGMLALHAAALDDRIAAALVSGYFGPREHVHEEPVYRNVWGLLTEFGDAEVASLIAPRSLTVEYSPVPTVPVRSDAEARRAGTGGRLVTPTFEAVREEVRRVQEFFTTGPKTTCQLAGPCDATALPEDRKNRKTPDKTGTGSRQVDDHARIAGRPRVPVPVLLGPPKVTCRPSPEPGLTPKLTLIHGEEPKLVRAGSAAALESFVHGLGLFNLSVASSDPAHVRFLPDADARQRRQVEQIERYLLEEMHHLTDFRRYRFLKGDASTPQAWDASMRPYREYLYDEVIGRLPEVLSPLNVRRREVFDEEDWTGHEVVFDVLPGVVGWGVLAVPKDMGEGEKRPVVVVQHGHAGRPTTAWRTRSYNGVLPELCRRGFIVFAPFAPYQFDVRRATPLGASVYSVLIPLHRQIVRWLATLDEVDADRIGFYGKSWGGRSALRIPPFVPEYRVVVCSAYFNQWPRKAITPHYQLSYQYTRSIGVYEFDQGNTFGHAELAMLIAPRPFMVENGYNDAVMPAEWAAYEFAKIKRLYDQLGIGDRAVFGGHLGGHEVDFDTVFPFLRRHLDWPPTR